MRLRLAGFFRELSRGNLHSSGPSLAESVGKLPADQRHRAAQYLSGGSVLATTGMMVDDWFDKQANAIAPRETRTDGVWLWSGDLAYYVRKYGVALPPEFLSHMAARGWKAPPLDDQALRIAEENFFKVDDEG